MKALHCLKQNFSLFNARFLFHAEVPSGKGAEKMTPEDEEFNKIMSEPMGLASDTKRKGKISPVFEGEGKSAGDLFVSPEKLAEREAKKEKAESDKTEYLDKSYAEGLARLKNTPYAPDKLSPRQKQAKEAGQAKLEKEIVAGDQPGVAEKNLEAWANSAQGKTGGEAVAAVRSRPKKGLDKAKVDEIAKTASDRRAKGFPEAVISGASHYEGNGITPELALTVALADVFGAGNTKRGLELYLEFKTGKTKETDALAAVQSVFQEKIPKEVALAQLKAKEAPATVAKKQPAAKKTEPIVRK